MAACRRWLVGDAPARRLSIVRIIVGGYATVFVGLRAFHWLDVAGLPDSRFRPIGILAWLDEPLSTGLVASLSVAAFAAAVAFTVGWRFRVTAPLFAVLLVVLTTHGNSWGQIFHTENLLVLHVIVLAVSPADRVLAVRPRSEAAVDGYAWPLQLMSLITVVTYVLAGWAKLRVSGLDWVTGDVLRNLVAHDNLRKILLGDPHSPLGGWLVGYGWVFPPMAVVSTIVEIGAPIALLSRRLRNLWVGAAWLFHVGVLALMAILFPYQLLGVAYVSFFPMEQVVDRVRERFNPVPVEASGAA